MLRRESEEIDVISETVNASLHDASTLLKSTGMEVILFRRAASCIHGSHALVHEAQCRAAARKLGFSQILISKQWKPGFIYPYGCVALYAAMYDSVANILWNVFPNEQEPWYGSNDMASPVCTTPGHALVTGFLVALLEDLAQGGDDFPNSLEVLKPGMSEILQQNDYEARLKEKLKDIDEFHREKKKPLKLESLLAQLQPVTETGWLHVEVDPFTLNFKIDRQRVAIVSLRWISRKPFKM